MSFFKSVIILVILFPLLLRAQTAPVTASFAQNGELICTNLQPGTAATVEWAPSIDGPWTNNWAGLDAVIVNSNRMIHVSVPMFYRVRGMPFSTNAPTIETSVPLLNITETSSGNFGVRLSSAPAANVTVAITSGNSSKASVNPTTLTFTGLNWNTYQTVTVTGVNDADSSDDNVPLTLSSPGLTNQTLDVAIADDDLLAIETSTTSISISEGGGGTFGVRLTAQPLANVTVSVASGNTSKATASPSSLSFTPSNWNIYQTITASGVQDPNAINESIGITMSSSGLTSKSVNVNVIDDDTMAIETSMASLSVDENGTNSFNVRLTAQPIGNTTVTVASGSPTKASVNPTSLNFTTSHWSSYQTVIVTGMNDVNTSDESVTVTLSASGMNNRTVDVTVVDDDF